MTNIPLKILGLFMTVFAVSQLGHLDNAQASSTEVGPQTDKHITTSVHGNGCGCGCCMKSEPISE